MANEFNLTLSCRYTNGELSQTINVSETYSQTTLGMHAPVVTVNTSASEALSIGDVATEGFMFLKNLDSTNYVQWGAQSSTGGLATIGRIRAGEFAWLRMDSGATMRFQANTAPVKLQVVLFED